MGWWQSLTERLDIRPGETRSFGLSFAGAFLVLAFMVLARSLRDALYLTTFDVETLPYMIAAVVVLSLPAVSFFTRLLERHHPQRVLRAVTLMAIGGLLPLWASVPLSAPLVIVFYVWTALATLLLTSGFWVVTGELFAVRGAKRLFGLIAAGGTAGAMAMGFSLQWLTSRVELVWLAPVLIGLLALFYATQTLLPHPTRDAEAAPIRQARHPMKESLRLIARTPHLRLIAWIVFTATMASTLVDYQFKELARESYASSANLAGFFGAFYAWTGAIALGIQLVGASRIIAAAGVGAGLAILPAVLLLGSAGLLLAPTLWIVTLLRGGDNTLRKAIHRPLLEYLYIPIPVVLRRRTKTFIDSVVDSLGEGLGAGAVFLLVTLAHVPSRYLSVLVILLAVTFIVLSRRMGQAYFGTIVERLQSEEADSQAPTARNLLSASFTRLDLQSLRESGEVIIAKAAAPAPDTPEAAPASLAERLSAADAETIEAALGELFPGEEETECLLRLLARDRLYHQVVKTLIDMGEAVVPRLAAYLRDPDGDFVIRRRIPAVLAAVGGPEADDALLDALASNRFEVRYRAAVALRRRRRRGLPESKRPWRSLVWMAIEAEIRRDRPVWELQRLLDASDAEEDELVIQRVGSRGELSLEHTFRMMTLVLDPEPVRAAFHGILLKDETLESFALEYLEQVLPERVRKRLWVFIGDVSDVQRKKSERSLDRVVSDLMTTRATLFAGPAERDALRRMLEDREKQ